MIITEPERKFNGIEGMPELEDFLKRSINENLSQKDIKKAIKNWKGDYHRV
jgi:uncharacterized protein YeeX (DUF496 family)